MADVPFLGCKISLISKSDIRYEGILYCVDAKESTIALSKVKSYGTETRVTDPSNYVAPKNEVFDIIIFRASDVKDLRVDAPEPPGLSDPAIISAHHSYPGQSPSTSSFNTNINSNINTTNPSNTGVPTLNSNGSLPNSGPSNQHQQQQQHHQHQQKQQHQKPLLPFLPTGSKENNNQQQQIPVINYSSAVANAQRRARPEPRDKRSEDANNKKPTHDSNNRDNINRRDDRRGPDKRDDRRDDRRNDRRDDRRDDRRGPVGDDRRGASERRGDDGRRGGGDSRSNNQPRLSRGGYDNNRNHVNSNMRYHNNNNNNNNNYNSRRGPNNRDNNSKDGGRPMYRRGPMQGRRGRSRDRTGAPRGPRKGAPLKFDAEYDFDEANKLFLELEGKFKGMKIKSGEEKDGAESSGDGANSKSPTGQSESGSGYDSEDQNNKDGDSKDGYGESVSGEFYDKTKSFFDNISCEASERSQGKVNKPDWRKERQMNAETFGVSANYRRGGYRGRVYGANGYHRR